MRSRDIILVVDMVKFEISKAELATIRSFGITLLNVLRDSLAHFYSAEETRRLLKQEVDNWINVHKEMFEEIRLKRR